MSDNEDDEKVYGPFEIELPEKSKAKLKEEQEEFQLDEADLFVDESNPMLNHLHLNDEPLIGMDQIVDDQTHDNLKCILCRVILKDRYSILDHLRDVQHQCLFMERYHPKVYKCLTDRRESAPIFCAHISKYAVELVKENGRARARTYKKGYGKKAQAAAEKRQAAAEKRQAAERRKYEAQMQAQMQAQAVAAAAAEAAAAAASARRRSSQDDRSSSRSSRSPHRSRARQRSRSRSRSREAGSNSSRSKKTNHRKAPPAASAKTASSKSTSRSYRRQRDSSDEEDSKSGQNKPSSSSGKTEEPAEYEEEDVYGELPTDTEITGVLFAAKLGEYGPDEKAFIHKELEDCKRPICGLDFVAEYADPRKAYQPGYLCVICDARFSPSQILNHVICERHRLKYMERRHKNYFATATLKTLPPEVKKDLIVRYAGEIEQKEGRGTIKKKIHINDTDRLIFRHHKPLTEPIMVGRKRIIHEPDAPKLAFDPSKVEVVDRRAVPTPPKIRPSYTRPPLPQRPDFVYSEKSEKEKQLAQLERMLPPFVEKNLESGWYSVRQYTLGYFQRLVPPMTPYISIRCPQANGDIYGPWSPYLMRRIQDQFNFTLDHLSWLQKLLLEWRIPLSEPLDEHELRPLADEVETAVLNTLVGEVLQPNNFHERIHDREVFEYDDRLSPSTKRAKKRDIQTIVYDETIDESGATTNGDRQPAQKLARRSPSIGSVDSSGRAPATSQSRSNQQLHHHQSLLLTPTPSSIEDDQKSTASSNNNMRGGATTNSNEKAVAERAIIALIDQILQTAKDSKSNNSILNMIVRFDNARSILFILATKQPQVLQQLVVVMKNPKLVVPSETLHQLEKKFKEIAKECNNDLNN